MQKPEGWTTRWFPAFVSIFVMLKPERFKNLKIHRALCYQDANELCGYLKELKVNRAKCQWNNNVSTVVIFKCRFKQMGAGGKMCCFVLSVSGLLTTGCVCVCLCGCAV